MNTYSLTGPHILDNRLPPLSNKNQKDSIYTALGIYGAIGFQLAASVVGGILIGDWLDKKWDTNPWLMLTGLMIGVVGGFVNMIRLLNWKSNRNESSE